MSKKADLRAEADARGIAYVTRDSIADLEALLNQATDPPIKTGPTQRPAPTGPRMKSWSALSMRMARGG